MTVQARSYPVVESVVDMFGNWLKHRREILETCRCDAAEFGRIAQDLGISTGDLDDMVRLGPHAADELPKMLKSLGIDEEAIARSRPAVLRDMERVCASCQHKHRCNSELADGTAAQTYEEFCGNASTIDALGPRRAK